MTRRKDNLNKYLNIYNKPILPKLFRMMNFGEFIYETGKDSDPDNTYYVIRINPQQRVGVFAYYRHVLGHVIYAVERGYIPVVNLRDYKNMYIDWPNVDGINGWEVFFEQPGGVDLEYALACKNVIFSDVRSREEKMHYNDYLSPRLDIKRIANNYIRLNEYVLSLIDETKQKLFAGKGRICGIKLRGSDYAISKFKDHAIVPEISRLFSDVMSAIDSWDEKYDCFFLSTEDDSILRYFQDQLGEKLIYLDIPRYQPDQIWYESEKDIQERRREGYEYCMDVGLLAQCDALITTVCQGAGAAVMMNNSKYEKISVLQYGVY